MNYHQMTAPCGLDCFNCPMYLANDNEKLRQTISGRMGIPFEQPCNVYRCILDKGIQFCSECDAFPCDHLHPYADQAKERPHNTKVFNLCLIKKMGLENWAEQKALDVKNTYFKGSFKL
jgi:hypothetical protein